jgi:Tfp pilus assembly protein PilV
VDDADTRAVLSRAHSQKGFGLIELLMSMTMLNIGILALVAAFQSGAFALQRASKASTAAALADIQMERYRALKYDAIALDSTAFTTAQGNSTYTGDTAYVSGQVTTTCTGSPLPIECQPIRSLKGPDGKLYRIDSYVVLHTPASARVVKRVTLVVRDGTAPSKTLARIASTFDQATGS